MNEDTRRPLTTKVHLYHALYFLNRGFDVTLAGLKRLEELGVFRSEDLSEHTVNLELTRCEANDEITGVLQGYEENDSAVWDERRHEREKRLADPDDVFFAARDRRQEIREKMKELQAGLARQHAPLPHAGKRRRTKRKQTKNQPPKSQQVTKEDSGNQRPRNPQVKNQRSKNRSPGKKRAA
ncbi:MAG: hypothetical protein ACM3SW_01725 [Actinomycetota bacterium]